MNRILLLTCTSTALTMLTAAHAHAALLGPTPYLSSADSPFAGLGLATFHVEDFEDGALNTPGLFANGGQIAQSSSFVDSVDADDGSIDGSGATGRSWYSGSTISAMRFTFDADDLGGLPTHAGVVWTDVGATTGALGFGGVTFEAFDALGASLGVIGPVTLGDGTALSATAEDRFFGAVNAGGISAIEIRMDNSTDWEIDHVQYGLPTPATVTLLALAGATLTRQRRR